MGRATTSVCLFLAWKVADALDQNDPTLPTKSGVKMWVDVETPDEFHTMTSSRGDPWDLVMSDEFNLAGRNFTAGHDHLWVALDIPDGVNRAVGVYTPENALTVNGTFQIRVDATETNVTYYNVWSDAPSWTTKTMYYRAAMMQTWNKFCIQGGFVEISAKMPGATRASMNPHITGKRWDGNLQRDMPVQFLDRIPDIKFYPTWPGLWMMGNLGRALFAASTNRMWPWTYSECDERYDSSQRISACNPNPGYGLHPNMGRGSPEIDILEGGGSDISSSLQIAPGMPDEYRLEFIKAHITNYTDPNNPDIAVAGRASCNTNDDCTAVASVTGSCVENRCQCVGVWTGPRCTKYDLDTVSYGPSVGVIGGVCGFAVVGSALTLILRLRRHHAVRQYHEAEARREKRSSCLVADPDVVRDPTS
ncbi:hypothetical protein SDRG_11826 [Saprolegnia diclina VS20]|uniref:EGF-like domain-containing protein n=1 Tax=Saprolegnia diclina (strain VS20) TaxID=1156394 RepID=T0PY99_SAPDV|nr:hypothetical protein SDRG_11826 [Saprolegnia diclina VS20]EQC30509.1 hypothetical protein SDRG_11826 [Saprolegnia diclina VS20]|eukprot:XP_008616102.1 hypothetical protein SDRG_11826 [Saprolegnia diclina VS20]